MGGDWIEIQFTLTMKLTTILSVAVIDLQSCIGPSLKLGTTCKALNKSFSSIQSLLLYRIKDIEYLG